ncbi:very long-chain acyl-CoA synthetase-like isoform X2 [Nematolebias whitei]|uniref:very long-chain acyl-CoA synthetase-like isoform X2 n=1 Tax=Nematolebias whitei TaxID=451745 RepID=UPI00189BD60D|nr:very long-chain acyl-CoA synthetase-like isoform X2 [Nematolebias whitei]
MIAFILLTILPVLPVLLYWGNPYFLEDLKCVIREIQIRREFGKILKNFFSLVDCFLDQVKKHPQKTFLVFEDSSYTYSQADRESNKVARALQTHTHLKEGDTVALFLGNEPQFVWVWLGLAKLGCVASLLNTNIRSKSLLHCFSCCEAKVLITGAELRGAVEEVLPALREQGVRVFLLSESCDVEGMESLSDHIQQASDQPLSPQLKANMNFKTPALYIYTSGTTGCTVVLRRKFSASNFWNDCRKYNVTVIQYIGETMRYLCNMPKRDNDKDHKVRLAVGNGIRADTWTEFLEQFGNVRICEFYGATESNVAFVNYTGKVGAIGREHFLHKLRNPYALIEYDTETEEPIRDSRGFCIKVPKGETGLLVAKIGVRTPFFGYAKNEQQTERKKLKDVFEKGDVYFNSGDLLRIDNEGFIYFQDRIGDTFRWKGENVATTEVADLLLTVDFVEEANVYGVKVPGYEGRIGMAALTLKENVDFDNKLIYQHVKNYLPSYARPRFIRIQDALPVTGTFKQLKKKLSAEGFNPNVIQDPLFFLEDNEGYVSMSQEIFSSISEGTLRL